MYRYIIGFIVAIISWIWFSPSPITPCYFTLPTPLPLEGALKSNSLLSDAKLFFKDYDRKEGSYPSKLRAEGFEVDGKGGFYTGLGDGRIMHMINLGGSPPNFRLEEVIRTGSYSPMCGSPEMEYYCGRPLGLHIHPITGTLYIADTRGLLELNLETKELKTVITEYEGSPILFPNSITMTKNGKLYFTDSSKKVPRSIVFNDILEACGNGRLFSYDPESGKLELILENLYFPNGLQITPDESALIFAESTRYRLLKYHLTGSKKGQVETFLDNTPGLPDNIRYSPESDVYWVGMSSYRVGSASITDFLANKPWLRLLIFKLFSTSTIISTYQNTGIIIAIDRDGQIVKSLQDPEAKLGFFSEVVEQDGYLYIGSWFTDWIVQVDATQYLPLKK